MLNKGLVERFLLPPRPEAVPRMRQAVRRLCRQAGLSGEICDTAALLTTETVTNAVIHAQSEITVVIRITARSLRVEVSDLARRHPTTPDKDTGAAGGRGIMIVQTLATAWGIHDNDTGKSVWFELDHPPGPSDTDAAD